jgi:hypothetical protein
VGGGEVTGGLFSKLPKRFVNDPDLTPEVLFLVTHMADKQGFGCNHTSMEKEVGL